MARACRNQGRPGVVACAISAVDIAAWDLRARLLGVPLADLFGRAATRYPSTAAADSRRRRRDHRRPSWRTGSAIGTSLGSRSRSANHGAQTRTATSPESRWPADVVGDDVEVYVDANGGYSVKQAIRMGQEMADDTE